MRIHKLIWFFAAMFLIVSKLEIAFAGPPVIHDANHIDLLGGPQVFTNNGANCGWNLQYYGPTQRQWVQNCSQTNTAATVTNYGEQDQGITNNWVANRGAMQTAGKCGWNACPPPTRWLCQPRWGCHTFIGRPYTYHGQTRTMWVLYSYRNRYRY